MQIKDKKTLMWIVGILLVIFIAGNSLHKDEPAKKADAEEDVLDPELQAEVDAALATEDDSADVAEEAEEDTPEEAPFNLESEMARIAGNGGTETEKADEAEALARTYLINEDEYREWKAYLETQFINGNYLNLDEEFTLRNIFMATAVGKYAEDNGEIQTASFAFDFYQNTKYVYRGVNVPGDADVVSNEEQMQRALEQ